VTAFTTSWSLSLGKECFCCMLPVLPCLCHLCCLRVSFWWMVLLKLMKAAMVMTFTGQGPIDFVSYL